MTQPIETRRIAVVVLAAGVGSRLGHTTCEKPKWLLDVANRPLADWHCDLIEALGGRVSRLLVVAGHAASSIPVERLRARLKLPVTCIFNPRFADLNNWYSLRLGVDMALSERSEDVLIVNSDLYIDPASGSRLASAMAADDRGDATLAVDVAHVPSAEAMKVATFDADRIGAISKTLGETSARGEYIGMSYVRRHHLPHLGSILHSFDSSDRRHDWYEAAFQEAIDGGSAYHLLPVDAEWAEIDDASDLARAEGIATRA